MTLSTGLPQNFAQRGLSRRSFGRLAAILAAGSTLPFHNEFTLAAIAQEIDTRTLPPGAVKIDSNENPLGPCPEALEAIHNTAKNGGRYMFDLPPALQKTVAEIGGLKPNYVGVYAGSSAPLHQATLAFTSPSRAYVVADPGYEAGDRAAEFVGAKVVRVPLTKEYAHDVKAMVAAAPNAGLFYVCNPNNPTGTLTARSDMEWLVANKPSGSVVLLDEAYIHFSGTPSATDLIAADKDVIILRTFSKIYGMAGLRAGVAIGRPDLLEKIRPYSNNFLPCTGMIGAICSLKVKNLVPERRQITKEIRADVFNFLDKHNFHYVPSLSNKFMVDVKRPGREVTLALRKENVYIGRSWPSWPTYVRVSVGTQEEMNKFKAAFLKVMT